MKARIEIEDQLYQIDFSKPISIAIPLGKDNNPNCYFTNPVEFKPNQADGFIGSIQEGGPVNHIEITFSPHGNGTHTECSGHIFNNSNVIDQALVKHHFICQLITVIPELRGDDSVITLEMLKEFKIQPETTALIIRTLPNSDEKLSKQYSGTNPTYLEAEAIDFIVSQGIDHLIVDLPSIDPEEDGGKLLAHKSFWRSESNTRRNTSITELAYIPDHIQDGVYLLDLQILRINLDVSPSNPILFSLTPIQSKG